MDVDFAGELALALDTTPPNGSKSSVFDSSDPDAALDVPPSPSKASGGMSSPSSPSAFQTTVLSCSLDSSDDGPVPTGFDRLNPLQDGRRVERMPGESPDRTTVESQRPDPPMLAEAAYIRGDTGGLFASSIATLRPKLSIVQGLPPGSLLWLIPRSHAGKSLPREASSYDGTTPRA